MIFLEKKKGWIKGYNWSSLTKKNSLHANQKSFIAPSSKGLLFGRNQNTILWLLLFLWFHLIIEKCNFYWLPAFRNFYRWHLSFKKCVILKSLKIRSNILIRRTLKMIVINKQNVQKNDLFNFRQELA